jgi:hypothetical protein
MDRFWPGKYHKRVVFCPRTRHSPNTTISTVPPVLALIFKNSLAVGIYARGDRAWEDHTEYCIGCEICEIAVRLWRPGPQSLELRFHVKCFNKIIVKRNRL